MFQGFIKMVFQKGNQYGKGEKGKPFRGNHWTRMPNAPEIQARITAKLLNKKYSPNPVTTETKTKSPYRYNILVKRILQPSQSCMMCGIKLPWDKLQLHHEDVFNRQPETVDINKLKVLCPRCHKNADVALWKSYKLEEGID